MVSEQEHCYFRCIADSINYCNLVMTRYRLKNQSVNFGAPAGEVRLSRKLPRVNAPRRGVNVGGGGGWYTPQTYVSVGL